MHKFCLLLICFIVASSCSKDSSLVENSSNSETILISKVQGLIYSRESEDYAIDAKNVTGVGGTLNCTRGEVV